MSQTSSGEGAVAHSHSHLSVAFEQIVHEAITRLSEDDHDHECDAPEVATEAEVRRYRAAPTTDSDYHHNHDSEDSQLGSDEKQLLLPASASIVARSCNERHRRDRRRRHRTSNHHTRANYRTDNTNLLQSDTEHQQDEMGVNNNYCDKTHRDGVNWYIYLVTALSAIGGFLFGYDTGIVSGAMVFIRDYFGLSATMQEVVISVTILTAWIFSLLAGYLTNRFGRKWIIILASFVFTIGGLMMALAHNEYMLLAGRATVGLAIGLASMAIPVYIAEVAPVEIRGKMVSINTCFITFGQFVASVVAGFFSTHEHGWRWMLGLASVPSALQLVFFTFMPESPRWLIQKGRYEEAFESLTKFRMANTSEADIKVEYDCIKDKCLQDEDQDGGSKSIKEILSNRPIRRALFVGCLLMMFQQLAGINTVMYYSATIIQMSGINDKSTAVWLSSLTASINFIFSFVGLVLVEKLGRRLLTLSSLFGVVISLVMLAAGFQLANLHSPPVSFHPESDQSLCNTFSSCGQCIASQKCGFCFTDTSAYFSNGTSLLLRNKKDFWDVLTSGSNNVNGSCLSLNPKTELPFGNSSFCLNGTTSTMTWATTWCPSNYSWMTLGGLMLYLFFFAPGMGPMPWTVNSEIYPLWSRSFCYSASTSMNWFFNLLVSLTFLTLTQVLTTYGAFYLYACLALLGWILFFCFLPETKGKSLEEIESLFEGPLLKICQKENLSPYGHMTSSVNSSQSTVSTSDNVSQGQVQI